MELDRDLEIEGFIVLVFERYDFFGEASIICTVEEMKEYYNAEIFHNLNEERQKYFRSIFEDTDE